MASFRKVKAVLQGGNASVFQYNSNSSSTQFVLVNGACTLVRISNLAGTTLDVFDANSTGQSGTDALFVVPANSVLEVKWPMQVGVVLSIPQTSAAAISYAQ